MGRCGRGAWGGVEGGAAAFGVLCRVDTMAISLIFLLMVPKK